MSSDMQSIKNMLFRVASEVSNEAKELAPYKSGNLKRDIQVFDDKIDNLEISIGNTKLAYYAPFVHQGTGRQAKGKSRAPNKKGQKSQPYFTDGLDNYVSTGGLDDALEDMGEEIADEFKEQLKKSLRNVSIT